ncbi:serine hydrolase [Kaistia granuli]|uniref:serine hydrolase n=1 Tax=Kaistia granuli TaxID=363259 RepID=UPI00035EFF53|nr:serine hydrolase [Kaistia granuli]
MRLIRQLAATTAILLSLACATPAGAAVSAPEARLETLFASDRIKPDAFSASFLADVPAAEVARLIAGLTDAHGPLQSIVPDGSGFLVRLTRATVHASITLDAQGKITGLWFGPAAVLGGIADHAASIRALPGATTLLVLSDGKEEIAHLADEPFAVGSAAKLAILAALQTEIAQGKLTWDQAVPLKPAWKSLPTGILQDWPAGTPLTVATLANLMISISDNTATDALIDILGREAVEAVTPANAPFPTTRQFFTLKTEDNGALRAAWRSGDAAARRAILAGIADAPLPSAISSTTTHEVEWFMSARELCRLLDATAALPAFDINPGVARPDQWRDIAFKGGSEIGVLNLSSRVVGQDGRVHCVVASWNDDEALDDERLIAPYRAILARLAVPEKD